MGSWFQNYTKQRKREVLPEPHKVRMVFRKGTLDGRSCNTELYSWPPERLYAGDIEPYAVGSYELEEMTYGSGNEDDASQPDVLVYVCRIDADYVRVMAGRVRIKLDMARAKMLKKQ